MDLIGALEGILFVVGSDGITFDRLKEVLEISDNQLINLISTLENNYDDNNRGFKLEILGNKYKLMTKKEHKKYYENLVEIEKNENLSAAALETLAIIAYNEPITRLTVDEIRGVDSSHMVRKLLIRNLIKEVGRSDLPGRPILYSVTNQFLDYLGLSSIEELPKLEIPVNNEEIFEDLDLYESKYKEN